jgi:histidine triad (HIT) family protein
MTIFEKIVAREIPARIVYEDEEVLAFHDVAPKAPVHVLIVPKRAIPRLAGAGEAGTRVAAGLEEGWVRPRQL